MIKVIIKAVLLLHLFQLIAGQSPCPDYFQYVQDEASNKLIGYIKIPSPPIGVNLRLSVSLSIAVALPSKYVGRLELARSKEQSIKAVNQGRPLTYKVHFPFPRPIPSLTGLWFNDQLICSGPRATGPIVTTIMLNHTLFPPGNTLSSGTQPATDTNPIPSTIGRPEFPIVIYSPWQTELNVSNVRPAPANNNQQNDLECGRSSNKINPLIVSGEKTYRGQWPWLAAIFLVKLEFEFQCAGTLISNNHVITAAHCLILNNVNLPPGTFLISLGRYRLREWRGKGSVNREVEDYKLHPDYDGSGNADSDLAVLVLRESVPYTSVIKPICLWSGSSLLSNVVGKVGHVVGWGRDEAGNRYVQEPRQTKSPIVAQEVCLWSNRNFVAFTSNRTFCAGERNGSGPCNGDSGSGFVIYNNETDRYYLRGVVSRSLLDSNTLSCDLTQFVIYVDIAQHLDWIQKQISV